jgi:hypothetical protein
MHSMTSTTDGTRTCPSWCEEHVQTEAIPNDPSGVMTEHRSTTWSTSARHRGAGPAVAPDPARVWVSMYRWEDGTTEGPVILAELPCDQEVTELTAPEARDLADSLLEGADLLDGEGRTNSTCGCDRD